MCSQIPVHDVHVLSPTHIHTNIHTVINNNYYACTYSTQVFCVAYAYLINVNIISIVEREREREGEREGETHTHAFKYDCYACTCACRSVRLRRMRSLL